MQRIALIVCALVAAASGCAKAPRITDRPLPDPLLSTRHAPRRMVKPAPQRWPPRVARREPYDAAIRLNEGELLPPEGIKRGRWRVIVVHHSAAANATPKSMDRYHRRVRQWCNGLGYHFVIGNGVNTEDGRIYVGPRWKRQLTGAHCKSPSGRYFGAWRARNYFNVHGIGICLIGDFEQSRPTPRQLATLKELTRFLCAQTGINPAHVYGHRDVTHKTLCPGRHLSRELPVVRAAVAQALAVRLDPGRPPGWPSGLDEKFAARADTDVDWAFLTAYVLAKRGQVGYGGLCHAVDYVADLYAGAFGGTAVGYIDHDDAGCGCLDPHSVARVARELGEPHPAPENRTSPHPTDAADLAALHGGVNHQRSAGAP